MKDYLKFLQKLPKPQRLKLIHLILKISNNKLEDLDIKILSSEHKLFRCRVGKLRIIFQSKSDGNTILEIGFRGDIYKNFEDKT